MKISRKNRICLAVSAVAVLAGVFWPWLAAQGDYLWYREGIPYRGKIVPMPRGWLVTVPSWDAGPDLSFTRWLSCGICIRHPAWAFTSFDRETMPHGSPEDDVQGLGKTLRSITALDQSQLLLRGEVVVGPYRAKAQIGDAWCYTTSSPTMQFEQINCLLFDDQWTADYMGPRDHATDFFEVVEGIRDAKGK